MNNDLLFWNQYLVQTIDKIEKLLSNKDVIYTDLHIHSDYSADGKQSLKEIIKRAKKLGLDIISITDHDSIKVYDELYEYIKNNKQVYPIIIPGVEFTIENKEYGSQCHILQLMINPKETKLNEDIRYNERAQWNRTKIQFDRIAENKVLQHFIKKYNIICSIEKYKEFLSTCARPIPEYCTLMEYLMEIFSKQGITTWDIFDLLEEENRNDDCIERKKLKEKRYSVLRERYKNNLNSDSNVRFLHSMLAIKGVDDDFFKGYKSSGSLSVNYFNELKIQQLNRKHLTIWAHPSEDKLNIISDLVKLNSNIYGIELNKQCHYSNKKLFFQKAKELNMFITTGSDSHENDSELYSNMKFYKVNKEELKRVIDKAKEYVLII